MLVAASASAADLTVTIRNVHSDKGELLIGVYSGAEGYKKGVADSATKSALLPEEGRLLGASLRAKAGSQSITFDGLAPGRYAVVAFHDENDNGLLDQNALGIPTEGYGFSNDAYGFLGAPSFEAAAVSIDSAEAHVTAAITLSYPRAVSQDERRDYEGLTGSSLPPRQR
ncbi:MAG: DUF2141 domain-containing protein [Stellaceae bacterium]